MRLSELPYICGMDRLRYYDFTDVPIGVFAEFRASDDSPQSAPLTPSTGHPECFVGVISLHGGFYVPESMSLDEIFDPSEGFLVSILRHAYGLPVAPLGQDIPFTFRLPQGFRYIERPFLMPPEASPHTVQYQAFRIRPDGIEFRLFAESDIPQPYLLIPFPFALVRFPTLPKVQLELAKRIPGVDYGSCSC